MKNKTTPNLEADYKLGNAHYKIVRNKLVWLVDDSWMPSHFTMDEFMGENPINLGKERKIINQIKNVAMPLVIMASIVFATWVMK